MGKPVWMVRAGQGARWVDEFRTHGAVAISWSLRTPVAEFSSRDDVEQALKALHPHQNDRQPRTAASQIDRFRAEIAVGDCVVTYDPGRRVYLVGTVAGECEYDEALVTGHPNFRRVEWRGEVPRDVLSSATRNTLGAIQTLFRLSDEAAAEMLAALEGGRDAPPEPAKDEAGDEEDILRDIQSRSHEFIKDRLSTLDWDEMQELVAGLLRAMGYKTQVSPPGADRGKDIMASPDGFSFEQPRIVVEVKHRTQAIVSQEIRGFLGGRHKDDKGLYVSTGGFSKDARYEAERASIPVMLMDLDDLVAAIVEHYEEMDAESKSLVRLTRIYWPA